MYGKVNGMVVGRLVAEWNSKFGWHFLWAEVSRPVLLDRGTIIIMNDIIQKCSCGYHCILSIFCMFPIDYYRVASRVLCHGYAHISCSTPLAPQGLNNSPMRVVRRVIIYARVVTSLVNII